MAYDIFSKKYQVFISSTYTDLITAREGVIKMLLSLYQIPIGMEMFSADNEEQWETIRHTIDNSDYYVLILGHRYGSETKEGISFTEKEFDYAKATGVPVYAFIRNDGVATRPEEREVDYEKVRKQIAFRKKLLITQWLIFGKLKVTLLLRLL